MYIRHNPIRLVLLIGLLAAIVTSAGTPTPTPPKTAAENLYPIVAPEDIVPAGFDLFETDSSTSFYDFSQTPIPADFFGPGSDPFTGSVEMGGKEIDPDQLGTTDTIVERLSVMHLPPPYPSSDMIPIELVELSLVSVEPIVVPVGRTIQVWNVNVGVSHVVDSKGEMTITKVNNEGGTFDSVLYVQPLFTFTRVADGAVRQLDTGALGLPPLEFVAKDVPWRRTCPPEVLKVPGVTTEFFCASVDDDGKVLTEQQARLAKHGVKPGQPAPPKTATPACESIPDVKLGEKGAISCTGFTPNGEVKLIFEPPDKTKTEHIGKADRYGNFDGTFTVALDRPPGQWMLSLVDLSTGQTIAIPFRVIPLVTATPVSPTVAPTSTLRALSIAPTLMPTPTIPLSRALPTPTVLILPCAILVVIFTALLAGLVVFMRRRFRRRHTPLPPQPPPAPPAQQEAPPQQQPQQFCGFRQETLLRTVEGAWKVKEATTVAIAPHSDPVTIVVWEKKIYNEFEVIGPCPLPPGHGGDHQPKTVERRFVTSFTEEESYPYSVRKPKPPEDKGLPKVKD